MATVLSAAAARSAMREVLGASRIVVVADDGRGADALAALLATAGLPVAGAVLPSAAIDALGAQAPHVVVLVADVGRPAGLAALRRLHAAVPGARVVVVARDDRGGAARATAPRQALTAGADAFVRREDAARALAAAVRAVLAGLVCAPRDVRRVLAKPTFSHREKEVLGLMTDGLTNKQIAAQLYLSESTVKTHLAAAFAKLGVRSRKDAAALLLDPAEGLAATALPVAAPRPGPLGNVA
jgi:DNA-binding NarL/FixJ family response regulator